MNPPSPSTVDSPTAPTVFVEQAVGLISSHGNVHITFVSLKADHSPTANPVARLVNLRIVMPVSEAHDLAVKLYDYLKTQGVDAHGAVGAVQQ